MLKESKNHNLYHQRRGDLMVTISQTMSLPPRSRRVAWNWGISDRVTGKQLAIGGRPTFEEAKQAAEDVIKEIRLKAKQAKQGSPWVKQPGKSYRKTTCNAFESIIEQGTTGCWWWLISCNSCRIGKGCMTQLAAGRCSRLSEAKEAADQRLKVIQAEYKLSEAPPK